MDYNPTQRQAVSFMVKVGYLVSAAAVLALPWAVWAAGYSAAAWEGLLAFALLHLFGIAHGRYKYVPLGFWIGQILGSRRNLYDRLVHVVFGLVASPALFEFAGRLGLVGAARLWAPLVMVMAISAVFEIVEWVAFDVGKGEFGSELQGDIWDTHKDMLCALCGALGYVALQFIFS